MSACAGHRVVSAVTGVEGAAAGNLVALHVGRPAPENSLDALAADEAVQAARQAGTGR